MLGYLAARDGALAARARTWRETTGALPGPFEAWLAHRSLATLEVRLARAEANARALARALEARDDVTGAADLVADVERALDSSLGCGPRTPTSAQAPVMRAAVGAPTDLVRRPAWPPA